MNEKDLLLGVLTKTLNRSEQEITELLYQKDGDEYVLKEGVVDEVLNLDSARVESIKKNAPVPKDRLDNEFKRGQKEALKKLEDTVKDKYSFDSEKLGIDLIDDIIADKSKVTKKITDDDVKKHPLYLDLEKSRVAKDEHDRVIKEFNDFKNNIEKTQKFSAVKDKAGSLLDSMKPIVSENPAVAKTRRDDFLSKFESYDYQIDGDNIIILKPDGSRLEDGHGNPLPFEAHVKNVAVLNYEFPKQNDKGNGGGDGGDNKTFNFAVPKNDAEYRDAIRSAKTLDEKVAIKDAYENSQK